MIGRSYLCCLLEWLLVDSDEDDCMRTHSIFGGSLNILDEVLTRRKVDKGAGAQLLQRHLLLVFARVDGDHLETHGLGILLGKRTESSTGADDGNCLAGPYS